MDCLSTLPNELSIHVLQYLNINDLHSARFVNKSLLTLIRDDTLYKIKLQRKLPKFFKSWKEYYFHASRHDIVPVYYRGDIVKFCDWRMVSVDFGRDLFLLHVNSNFGIVSTQDRQKIYKFNTPYISTSEISYIVLINKNIKDKYISNGNNTAKYIMTSALSKIPIYGYKNERGKLVISDKRYKIKCRKISTSFKGYTIFTQDEIGEKNAIGVTYKTYYTSKNYYDISPRYGGVVIEYEWDYYGKDVVCDLIKSIDSSVNVNNKDMNQLHTVLLRCLKNIGHLFGNWFF